LVSYLKLLVIQSDTFNSQVAGIQDNLVDIVFQSVKIQDNMASNVLLVKGDGPVQVQVGVLDLLQIGQTARIFGNGMM
jgi:hypothetical protein